MTLRSQLYLLQLEDYDLARWKKWQKENPGREVLEKKSKIKWSAKATALYLLASIVGLETAVQIFAPIDWLVKWLLVLIAKLKLIIFHRQILTIGVTGSWGKTTTKEQLVAMLGTKYRVFKTADNNNTLLGVTLNVLRMPAETQVFICEMGAYKRGDIKQICELVRPKVGIVTAIGPMHLERFKSLEEIKKTKYELLESIPAGGLKVEPGTDPILALAKFFGVAPSKQMIVIPHRLEVKKNGEMTIIDDSYNSNPVGFVMALEKLKKTFGNPKILVTTGMIELGKQQFGENKKAAIKSGKVADSIIVVGQTNRRAWQVGLGAFTNKYFVDDIEAAQKLLATIGGPRAVILFENDLPDQYF